MVQDTTVRVVGCGKRVRDPDVLISRTWEAVTPCWRQGEPWTVETTRADDEERGLSGVVCVRGLMSSATQTEPPI